MTAKQRLAWIGVTAVVATSLFIGARPPGDRASPADRADRIAAGLRCPVCQGLSILDSDSGTARSIRQDIDRRIAEGQSDAEVRQAYVDRYGEWILLRPRGRGFAVTVWVVPIAAVLAALAGLGWGLWRWQRAGPRRATPDDWSLVEQAIGYRIGPNEGRDEEASPSASR